MESVQFAGVDKFSSNIRANSVYSRISVVRSYGPVGNTVWIIDTGYRILPFVSRGPCPRGCYNDIVDLCNVQISISGRVCGALAADLTKTNAWANQATSNEGSHVYLWDPRSIMLLEKVNGNAA